MSEWNYDMTAAPKDHPILGLCKHGEDRFHDPNDPHRLTLYAAHGEGLSYATDGPNVLEWGGGVTFDEDEGGGYLPDWWFVRGSEFEVVANPVAWAAIPAESE